ncbi:hypothetical protein [Marinobacter sp.]|uniref:hypothetical protein n=1 Tax=Marinobacter sp. TaxID=50741 RepID=UPI00356330E0
MKLAVKPPLRAMRCEPFPEQEDRQHHDQDGGAGFHQFDEYVADQCHGVADHQQKDCAVYGFA